MEISVEQKILEILNDINNRLDIIEKYIDVEINIDKEVRPEYIEKLKEIRKEKGKIFTSIEEFDAYFKT